MLLDYIIIVYQDLCIYYILISEFFIYRGFNKKVLVALNKKYQISAQFWIVLESGSLYLFYCT